jgi:hypothetical protein
LFSEDIAAPVTIDMKEEGTVFCQIKIVTPKGPLEVTIREAEDLFKLVNNVYKEGCFNQPDLRESLHAYFSKIMH